MKKLDFSLFLLHLWLTKKPRRKAEQLSLFIVVL